MERMTQEEFSNKIKINWKANLREIYKDRFEFVSGKVKINPKKAKAGEIGRWEITIQLEEGNSRGANWAFDILQIHNPQGQGYVNLNSESKKYFDLLLSSPNRIILIAKRKIPATKEIKIILGDTSKGSPGAKLKIYTQKVKVYVSYKNNETSKEKLVGEVAVLEVLPEEKFTEKIIIPSLIERTEKIPIYRVSLDRFGNPLRKKRKEFISIPNSFISKTKPYRVVKKLKGSLPVFSNPVILKDKKEYNLYWGEIHGHAYFSDGLESPDYFYQYAREVECLDFSSITEHDTWLDERKWELIKKAAEKYYSSGKFVTFLGFEWSSAQFYDPEGHMYGHKCVYYPGLEGEYYSHLLPEYRTPEKLWEKISKFGGISIAHHPAYAESKDCVWGTNWKYHNDELHPLVEIYSKHGLSEVFGNKWPLFSQDPERFVQKALEKGYKLGFVGGTDTHISRPASNMPEFRRGIRYPKGGLTAVWAEELTRESIFNALKNRRCYATTGERIIVKFKIGENYMGSIIPFSSLQDKINLYIFVAGTDRLEKIEIIKNNKVIESKSTNDEFLEFEYTDIPEKNSFYYIRVTQVDGNMSWSSPIWIE